MGIKLLQMWPFLFGGDLVLFELGMKVNASKAIKVGVLETLLKFETDTKFISFIHKQSKKTLNSFPSQKH